MAFIVNNTDWPTEKRLQIAGEEVYFPLQMGNNWAQIRIGVRWSAYCTWNSGIGGGNCTGYSRVGVAMCAGLKGFFHPSPDDVIAVVPRNVTPSNYEQVPVTNQFPWCVSLSGGAVGYWKQRNVAVASSPVGGTPGNIITNQQATRLNNMSAMFFDIDRSTLGTLAIRVYAPTAANLVTQPNWTLANLYSFIGSTGAVTNLSSIASGDTSYRTVTAAYTGNNIFDTLTVFNNHTANFVLEVATVAVCRLL